MGAGIRGSWEQTISEERVLEALSPKLVWCFERINYLQIKVHSQANVRTDFPFTW
jgi:hypothetical protein